MKCGQATFLRQRFTGGNYNFIGRDIVGAFLNATATEQTFRHGLIGPVIQFDVITQNMLGQCHLAARHSRFALKSGKRRAVGTTGAAFDTFFQLIFNPFVGIDGIVFHYVKPFSPQSH